MMKMLSANRNSVNNIKGNNNIELNWNGCEDATGYDVRIFDESGEGQQYIYYNIQTTSFSTYLPAGNYIAEVTAINTKFNLYSFGARTAFVALKTVDVGDTNLDGNIDIRDVTAIQRHISELELFAEEQLAVADTNGDGEINIADATYLQMYLAEYDIELG